MNLKSKTKLALLLIVPIFLTGCGGNEDKIISLGALVFVFSLIAYGINVGLGKLAATDLIRNLLLGRPGLVRATALVSGLLGAGSLILGLKEGLFMLFVYIGLSLIIIGILLPRSIDHDGRKVDFKKIGIFLICIYVLLFLFFSGEALFNL